MLALPAVGGSVSGAPRVVDGDTLVLQNTRVRLFGIDAPEAHQTCKRASGQLWACGKAATLQLQKLASHGVRCTGTEADRYGRLIAVCRADGRDINAQMVARGAAFAYRKYSRDYVGQEAQAKRAALGIWLKELREAQNLSQREWDTQSDMFFALVGAVLALVLLSRLHDRHLEPYL